MKIAIPVANGKLNMHFGHCEGFDLFEVDTKTKTLGEKIIHPSSTTRTGLTTTLFKRAGRKRYYCGRYGSKSPRAFCRKWN